MLGRGGSSGGNGVGLGDGIAGQLLAYQANKPIIDRILHEAGFAGADPIKALLGGMETPPQAVSPKADGAAKAPKSDGPVTKTSRVRRLKPASPERRAPRCRQAAAGRRA